MYIDYLLVEWDFTGTETVLMPLRNFQLVRKSTGFDLTKYGPIIHCHFVAIVINTEIDQMVKTKFL